MNEKSKATQKQKILQYLEENGSATVRELFIYCNINSPTKRLSELMQMGLVYSVRREKTNADGTKVHFNVYYLTKGVAA